MSDEITIRHLGPEHLDLLLTVPPGVFDNPILPAQARAFLDDPLHEIVLAYAGDAVVGMSTGTVLLHPDKPPAMFINEVGTHENWLRKGVATKMIKHLIRIARDRGCQGIWLGTEPDNTPALELYRSLDGDEEEGVFFGWDDAL